MRREAEAIECTYPNIKQSIGLILTIVASEFLFLLGLLWVLPSISDFMMNLIQIFLEIFMVILVWFWMRRKNWRECFLIKPIQGLSLLSIILFMIGSSIILSEVDNVFRRFWPIPVFLAEALSSLMELEPTNILLIVIIGPIMEEFLFRGVILRSYLNQYSKTKSIFISALLFSLFHLNPWQLIGAFFGGIILGLIFIKYRSLTSCILAHSCFNSIGFILEWLEIKIPGYNAIDFSVNQTQPLWFNILGVALLLIGLYTHFQGIPFRRSNKENKEIFSSLNNNTGENYRETV